MASCFPSAKTTFAGDVVLDESPANSPKRVLIVMDALKEFSIDLIEWVLRNFTLGTSSTVTLLGIKPWLNIPLSAKTWTDIWSMDLPDLFNFQEKNEMKNDPKYHKVQRLIELCQKYEKDSFKLTSEIGYVRHISGNINDQVVPEIKTGMGHPLRLLVVEQISSLHATLVVFDRKEIVFPMHEFKKEMILQQFEVFSRHHCKKHLDFYAQKIPCNMLAVNDNGDVHLIKKRTSTTTDCIADVESTPGIASVASASLSLTSTIPEHLIKLFMPKSRHKHQDY